MNESEPMLQSDGILKHVFYEFKIQEWQWCV